MSDEMQINVDQDSVPSTIEEAVDALWAGSNEAVKDVLRGEVRTVRMEVNGQVQDVPLGPTLHHGLGMAVRNTWSLWEDGPIRQDAIANYGIAHGDDIWSLMHDWLAARAKGDDTWNPEMTVSRISAHWARMGMTPLQAAGL